LKKKKTEKERQKKIFFHKLKKEKRKRKNYFREICAKKSAPKWATQKRPTQKRRASIKLT